MPDVGEILGKDLGPLPLGAWAVVGAGGVGLGLLLRKQFAASSAPIEEAATTSVGGTDTDTVGGAAGGGGYFTNGYGILDDAADDPSTNDEWKNIIFKKLQTKGFASTLIDSALGKYLSGQAVSDSEASVIEAALILQGPTPQSTFPLTRATPVQTPAAPAPAQVVAPVPVQKVLPKIVSSLWPKSLGGDQVTDIAVAGPGGFYQGKNVAGGAPVYALINGSWVQGFNFSNLAPGTRIGTPSQLRDYIAEDNVTTVYQ